MPGKLPSEIRRVALDAATFRGTGAYFEPTYVNFIFGGNGTGKSTIAKALLSGDGLTYAPGKTRADYNFLVYNQAFIDTNVRNYHDLPGVFTINDINVRIQEQIDEKEALQAEARRTAAAAATEKGKKSDERTALLEQLQKDCWKKTEDLRTVFDKTQEGKKKGKQFLDEVRAHAAKEHDLDHLRLMYDSAYSDAAKRYMPFHTVEDVQILDGIEGSDILGVVIANAAETGLASFLEEIGATEWFRQGHAEYHSKANGRCPYCTQSLPTDFNKTVADSFDNRYEVNLGKLNTFFSAYRETANRQFTYLSQLPTDMYPAIDIKPYNDKMAAIKGVIASNVELIKEKIAEPTKVVKLEETAPLLQELSEIITEYNRLIADNNDVVDAGPKKKLECRNLVFEHLAFVLQDLITGYERSDAALEKEIRDQGSIVEEQTGIVRQLQNELAELRTQTVETETAITNINTMLRDAGFQGFEVQPRKERRQNADGTVEIVEPERPINYEVVRTDTGEIASDLSEGEKNFIAFLYFQQKVFGSDTADGDARQKIVVIDDPVSSMDSSALFIIGEQVRKMIEICRNNADNRDAVIRGNFIKQIFILTHNAYFHREITYPHANCYAYVSFYLVKKRDNKSSIKLFTKPDPNEPTEQINVNPVKNSYAALWEEYDELKNVTSAIPVMNVMRRILEYYFLQICGYDGSQLRRTILEEHKQDYICNENGDEDYTKFDMATTMLSYIAASTYGVNEGLHYVDDVIDPQQCRDTFRMIFQHMGQDQHFRMMSGIR